MAQRLEKAWQMGSGKAVGASMSSVTSARSVDGFLLCTHHQPIFSFQLEIDLVERY
jgi:hypothetical protein